MFLFLNFFSNFDTPQSNYQISFLGIVVKLLRDKILTTTEKGNQYQAHDLMSKQLQVINLNDNEIISSEKARKVLGVLDSTIIDTDFLQILQDLILEEWEQV
jgi:hypothetical protein